MALGLGLGLHLGGNLQKPNVFKDAVLAYSLQDLGLAVTNVVRVRRSSDNTEQDFTPAEIANGTLTTFVGAGNDGLVTTLYDQSGNNNAVQTTAVSQPKIVSAGSLVLENGKPALEFDGVDDCLPVFNNVTAPAVFQDMSDFITLITVENPDIITGASEQWYNFNTLLDLRQNRGSGAKVPINFGYSESKVGFGVTDDYTSGDEMHLSSIVTAVRRLSFATVNGDKLDVYLDSINKIDTTFTTASSSRAVSTINSSFTIGCRTTDPGGFTSFYTGKVQELLLYKSDQSANRTAIENNINNRYNIY